MRPAGGHAEDVGNVLAPEVGQHHNVGDESGKCDCRQHEDGVVANGSVSDQARRLLVPRRNSDDLLG